MGRKAVLRIVLATFAVVFLLFMPHGIWGYANSFRSVRMSYGGEMLLPVIPLLIFFVRKNIKEMKSVKKEFFKNHKE